MTKYARLGPLVVLAAVGMFVFSGMGSVVAPLPSLSIAGTVTDINTGLPVPGATVVTIVSGVTLTRTTDATGFYNLYPINSYGTFTVTASKYAYVTQSKSITLVYRQAIPRLNFAMSPAWGFYGWVKNEAGTAVAGATVQYWFNQNGMLGASTTTDSSGYFWTSPSTAGINYWGRAYKTGYWQCDRSPIVLPNFNAPIRQDFKVQTDIMTYLPVAALFQTSSTSTSQITLSLAMTFTDSTKTSVEVGGAIGAAAASASTSYTRAYSMSSQLNSNIGQTSIVVKEVAYLTGKWLMDTATIESTKVYGYGGFFPTYNIQDYWTTSYAITNIYKHVSTPKAQYWQVPPGNPMGQSAYAMGSVTYQYSLDVTVNIPVVSGSAYLKVSSTSTHTNEKTMSTYVSCIDVVNGVSYPHWYLYFCEGTDPSWGMVFHVWDLGRTLPP